MIILGCTFLPIFADITPLFYGFDYWNNTEVSLICFCCSSFVFFWMPGEFLVCLGTEPSVSKSLRTWGVLLICRFNSVWEILFIYLFFPSLCFFFLSQGLAIFPGCLEILSSTDALPQPPKCWQIFYSICRPSTLRTPIILMLDYLHLCTASFLFSAYFNISVFFICIFWDYCKSFFYVSTLIFSYV